MAAPAAVIDLTGDHELPEELQVRRGSQPVPCRNQSFTLNLPASCRLRPGGNNAGDEQKS